MMQDSLARRARRIRLEHGLSLRAAASRVGVTKETLMDVEHGRREPHPSTLAKLAKGYGVEIADLLGPMVEEETETPKAKAPSSPRLEEGRRREEERIVEPDVKGPDPEEWGDPSERYDPATERIPASHGKAIDVRISEGTGEVTITEQSFLEVIRQVKRGEITPEQALERAKKESA
jgi:transcriptional regulator with XRE-family HTH domain